MRALRGPADASGPEGERLASPPGGWVPDDGWLEPAAEQPFEDSATAGSSPLGAPPRPPTAAVTGVGPSQRWRAMSASLVHRLPPALRGATIAPSRPAVAALTVVALAVVVLTGWLLLRDTPRPAVVEARPVPRTLPAAGRSPSPVKVVLVDVAGKVRRPGVVRLPIGSRVADALRAAGGVPPGVDIGLLNLARPLADGEQVVVGLGAVAGGPPSAGAAAGIASPAGGPVDLNAATVADLDVLPGVGPVLAQRIVDWREAHGPFTGVDQLREISGIGDRKFEDLKPRVRV